jgi:hypothetical protein
VGQELLRIIWSGMLVATVAGVVPVAVTLLSRALTAARQIERYTAEALGEGVRIADHTSSVAALKATISVAPRLLRAGSHIEQHTAEIAAALAPGGSANGRAEGGDEEVRP